MSKEYKIEIWQKKMQILKERLKDFGKFRENDLKEIEKLTKMTQVQKEKIADLETKLAEKDNKIKKLNIEAQKYYEDAYCNDFHNQDKISFAVNKLVGVQKYISDNAVYLDEVEFGREINEFIDNQIKQLKEWSSDEQRI